MKAFMMLGLLGFTACASQSLPPEASTVTMVPVSSASVEIHRPRLKLHEGRLRPEAYAFRQWKAETTANTHVDFVYLDAGGKPLAVETANFSPRSLPATARRASAGYMLVPVELPAGTRASEVRAHDGPHEAR